MKKILVGLVLVVSILMTSCGKPTDEIVLNEMNQTLKKFKNYKCISSVVVKSNKGQSKYKYKETFVKPDKIKLEIIEPKESFGCIIIYDGSQIFLRHPNISQTISMKNINSLNKDFFIGNFFMNLSLLEEPKFQTEKIGREEYIIFSIDIPAQNKYRWSEKAWINKKDFTPYKLEILNKEGEVNTEIFYEQFNYDVLLDTDL
ncbi:MAG: Outer membrane lipoprotein-sorting protein [Sporanaerobacter sp.]|jgi:outer membrane lipoprotein-sorting protein|uniref:LolA family protein n=1 Tax=Sporanaerobacter sp. TaxID=2010183 RepID=UPI003A101E21